MISGSQVQCQASVDMFSSFLASTSVQAFCRKAGGNFSAPAVYSAPLAVCHSERWDL